MAELPEGHTREEHELLAHYAFVSMVQTLDSMRLTDMNDAVDPKITRALELAYDQDSPGRVQDHWREMVDVRELYRALTCDLLTRMKAAGFVIKAPKPQKIDEMLELVMTVPARKAYTL